MTIQPIKQMYRHLRSLTPSELHYIFSRYTPDVAEIVLPSEFNNINVLKQNNRYVTRVTKIETKRSQDELIEEFDTLYIQPYTFFHFADNYSKSTLRYFYKREYRKVEIIHGLIRSVADQAWFDEELTHLS